VYSARRVLPGVYGRGGRGILDDGEEVLEKKTVGSGWVRGVNLLFRDLGGPKGDASTTDTTKTRLGPELPHQANSPSRQWL